MVGSLSNINNLGRVFQFGVSPFVFLIFIWLAQFLVYTLGSPGIDAPSYLSWIVVAIGCFSFGGGVFLSYFILYESLLRRDVEMGGAAASKIVWISLPLAASAAALLILRTEDQGFGLLSALKANLLEESTSGDKSSVFLVYLIIFNALSVIYYANTLKSLVGKGVSFVFLATAVLCLFSGSRGLLIFFIVSLVPVFVFHGRGWSFRDVALLLIFGLLAFGFFFLYPILFQRADFESGDGMGFFEYLNVYLFSGVGAFGHFVETGEPSYRCLLTVPRVFSAMIDFIFSTGYAADCPAYFQEVNIPLNTNVYTLFYPAMHDFGVLGVVFYLFFLGVFSGVSYIKGFFCSSSRWRFIYCVSFFSVFMSFFEDQFSRGLIYYFFAFVVLFVSLLIDRRFCRV